MEQAMQEIPKSRHKLTPLYLGPTAGMRLLKSVRKDYTLISFRFLYVLNILDFYIYNFSQCPLLQ
uniref:Uncharacterized protein n=1 Tax=Cyprinus carpio TaxID=7962 RepID=A0A8C2Q607_CYPCA